MLHPCDGIWSWNTVPHTDSFAWKLLELVYFSQILPVTSAHLGSLPIPFHRLHLTPQRLTLTSAFVLNKSNREVRFQ